jgi:hypothetical protein
MKIEGLDWMDWLRKVRRESEEERKRLGLSRVEWLKRMEQEADRIRAELTAPTQLVARDTPATKPPRPRGRQP